MTNIFDQAKKVYSYDSFLQLAEALLNEGKTTGDNQSEEYLFYAKLNLQRMQRWNKTFTLREDIAYAVKNIKPQIWWLITEGWCGDGAQNLPALAKMEEASAGNIKLNIVLRDENPKIIEQYLTNGTKSIPVLVAFDKEGNQLFRWGPRPVAAQALLTARKNEQPQRPFEEFEKEMHTWYTKDKGNAVQDEILALLQK